MKKKRRWCDIWTRFVENGSKCIQKIERERNATTTIPAETVEKKHIEMRITGMHDNLFVELGF